VASFRTHDKHGAVDWDVVKSVTPGLLAGVVGGVLIARASSTALLKYFYLAFTVFVTLQWVLNLKPKPSRELPWRRGLAAFGVVYLPAVVGISLMSMITARWGARTAHRLKGNTLRRIFALVLVALAVKVAFSV